MFFRTATARGKAEQADYAAVCANEDSTEVDNDDGDGDDNDNGNGDKDDDGDDEGDDNDDVHCCRFLKGDDADDDCSGVLNRNEKMTRNIRMATTM